MSDWSWVQLVGFVVVPIIVACLKVYDSCFKDSCMAHIGIEDLEERCENSRKKLCDRLEKAGEDNRFKGLRERKKEVEEKIEYLKNTGLSWMWAIWRRVKYNSVLRDIESMGDELNDIRKEQSGVNLCAKYNNPFANEEHANRASNSNWYRQEATL